MISLAQIGSHQAALDDLITLARRDLREFWRDLRGATPKDAAAATRAFMADLITAYGSASGALGADFYDDLRSAALAASGFAAVPEGPPDNEAIGRLLGWGLQPLFPEPADPVLMGPDPEPDFSAALSRLESGAQLLVANVDRATIITNTRRDPTAVHYARHASANACAFCAMLTTRQAAYRSEESAQRVVGRGTAKRGDGSKMDIRRKGVRARGSQELGEKYHRDCHCVAVPIWPGNEIEEAPYVADWREAYYAAADALGGASDTKAILAHMRQGAGLR